MNREIRSQNQQMKIANNGQPKGRNSAKEMPTSAIKTKVQLILKQKQINVIIINEEVDFFCLVFFFFGNFLVGISRYNFIMSLLFLLCIETKLDKSTISNRKEACPK